MDFHKLVDHAQSSSFGRWKLNFLLQRFIPFNKPHNLKVISISNKEVEVKVPYKRNNFNHIKGLHACVLATASEFSSGLLLLYKLDFKKYRIIMKSLQVEYHYQGKGDAIATFSINDEDFIEKVKTPLQENGEVYIDCEIKCRDEKGNHLCTAITNWQIKSWEKVKTKS